MDDSVADFIGRHLCARPISGWGWAEGDDDRTETVLVDEPTWFEFELCELFDWNGERRGGIGHIKQAGHVFDGYWLLFYTRQRGCFDFCRKIADYNFHIGRSRPSLYPPSRNPKMAEAWPLPRFSPSLSIWGYGRIGARKEAVEAFERERLEKWETEKRNRQQNLGANT